MSRYENMLYRFYNLDTSDQRKSLHGVISPSGNVRAIGETLCGKNLCRVMGHY